MAKQKVIKGDLILKEHFKHDGDLRVEGNIRCENGLWDIDARDINARDIDAWNIDAGDIKAWDIKAWNIDAGDIDAGDIICEKRIKKDPQNKTIARIFITERSKLKRKEW